MIQDLPLVPGVVPQLITAINDRLRVVSSLLNSGPASAAAPAAPQTGSVATSLPPSISAPHAARILPASAAAPAGTLWQETDRTLLYQKQSTGWVYVAGVMTATLANKPTDLGTADAGVLFCASDYARVFLWNGSGWQRAPGERPTREFAYFAEAPGTGWQLCDGSAGITYTKADTTTSTMTMPSETGGSYRKGGAAYTGTLNTALLPAVTGSTSSVSAGTPAGTVSQPTLSMNSYTPAGTASQAASTGSYTLQLADIPSHTHSLGSSGGLSITGGSYHVDNLDYGNSINTSSAGGGGAHSHTLGSPTFTGTAATLTGTVSQPTFAGSALGTHSHAAGTLTLASAAEPANVVLLPYMKL